MIATTDLDLICTRHKMDAKDRAEFAALVLEGKTPSREFQRRLNRGRLAKALDEALDMLSADLDHAFPNT